MRDGAEIGRHAVAFHRDGTRLDVATHGEVALKLAFVTVYRYQQRRTESWDAGRLVSFTAWTDDDGAVSALTGTRMGDGFNVVVSDSRAREIAGDAIPENYWPLATVSTSHLIDNTTGETYPITVTPGAVERIETREGPIEARRYHVQGGLGRETARDLWYDAQGRWVRMEIKARDGSTVKFVLR